ncbi:MAG: GGDEF domain-containing protein [Rhodocyclaceae bacterium]|nr:GGDEF domain-containing protein [Rhodocyclaceae bacterium]
MALVLYGGGTPPAVVAGWFAAVFAATVFVGAYSNRLAGVELSEANRRTLLTRRVAIGTLLVLLCGMSGFLLPVEAPLTAYAFLFLILSGLVSVAALAYAVMPAYYLALNGAALAPPTLLFLLMYFERADANFLLLIAMSIAWQAVIMKKALRVSHSAIDAIAVNERLQEEIVAHEQAREAIRHMALHDVLTDLANRRHFDETLVRTLGVAARAQTRFGLLLIDLDSFKPVNDVHGHAVGDRVLQAVADVLRGGVRGSDFVARLGGDEFAVILENIAGPADIDAVAHKLRMRLDRTFEIDGRRIVVAASIGSAMYPDDGGDTERLQYAADQRMYADKRERKTVR